MRAERYSTFSRDETEWGAFEDPRATFGAAFNPSQSVLRAVPSGFAQGYDPSKVAASQSVLRGVSVPLSAPPSIARQRASAVPPSAVQYDQNTLRGAAPPAPAPSSGAPTSLAGVMAQTMQGMQPQQVTLTRPAPGTQPAGAPNPLIAMLAAIGQRAVPNAPPLPASVTNQVSFAPLTTGQLQAANSRIQVNPAAGSKDLLANMLASVAHATLPKTAPLPASVTKQVQIVPAGVPSTATVQRAPTTPGAPADPATLAAMGKAAGLPPSLIAAVLNRRALAASGKGIYTGAQQQGFVPVPMLPAGLVHRATPSPAAPQIDMTGVLPFLTWVVNNAGVITEGANPLDTTTPQWWVYASGQVNRVG